MQLTRFVDSLSTHSYNDFNHFDPSPPLTLSMIPTPKDGLRGALSALKEGFRHAFAVRPSGDSLSADDLALLNRVAESVVRRGMATPATVALDSIGPLNFLGSQALHVLTPFLELAFNPVDLERIAALLERRETVTRLIALIDTATAARDVTTQ